jgi:hypothetical protein
VCTAAREGATQWLCTLPKLVVSGGLNALGLVKDVWRLNLAVLRWEAMPSLVSASLNHTCCAVRGTVVVGMCKLNSVYS